MSIEEYRQNLRWGLAGVGWDEEGLINLFEQLRTKLFSFPVERQKPGMIQVHFPQSSIMQRIANSTETLKITVIVTS